jgi:hypothetical protein
MIEHGVRDLSLRLESFIIAQPARKGKNFQKQRFAAIIA